MTPASFAKLVLRMVAASQLYLVIPPQIYTLISFEAPTVLTRENQGLSTVALIMLGSCILAVPVLILLLIWFNAARLAALLLPAGTPKEQSDDYAEWQYGGLLFIGGALALKTCMGLQALKMGDTIYLFDAHPLVFNFIAAILLIIRWDKIGSTFSGARKNTAA